MSEREPLGRDPPAPTPVLITAEQIATELAELRQWKATELARLELEDLRAQRARYEAGDLTALRPVTTPAIESRPVVSSGTSGLPRPKDPHVFMKKDRRDYNLWLADCEGYFADNPHHFALEHQKVTFAARYLSEELRTSWRMEIHRQASPGTGWEPTWLDLRTKMLDALGTELERKQRAMEAIKGCKQRTSQSPTDLLNYMRPLWEEIGTTDEGTMALEYFNCLLEWIKDDLYLQEQSQRKSVRDCEEAANISWRRHQSKNRGPKTKPEEKRPNSGGEGSAGRAQTPKKAKTAKPRHFGPVRDARPPTTSARSDVVCYHCNKPGHIKPNCELFKKEKKNSENNLPGKGTGQRR